MPRKWLLVRGQKDTKETINVTQDQFDFDFFTTSYDPDSPSTPVKTKTTMFNGPSFRSKKSRSELRPQSSNGSKAAVDKRLQLTKVEDSWIGVAFGSPTHPPTSIPGLPPTETSPTSKQSCRQEGTSPSSPLSMAKCRKFSNLFKSKPSLMSISAPTNVYKIDGDQKIGMPIAQKPWTGPNSPPAWINAENPEAFTIPPLAAAIVSTTEVQAELYTRPARSVLPKLEIQIPQVELDRYSVMFRDIPGIKPSNLLERRSRNLSNLKLANEGIGAPPVPALNPRKPSVPRTPSHHRRKSSTYSLFPSPPKAKAVPTENSERLLPRRQLSFSSRSQTTSDRGSSPERTIHKVEACYVTPERKHTESLSISPDDTIASSEMDLSPWRSRDSLNSVASSRTSVGSEIFFDLKPARDADGREQSQYIFHKADSSSVELAMSKSRRARKAKARKDEEDKSMFCMSPDLQAAEYMLKVEEKWRLSLELNQAIAEVERLTSPLGPMLQSDPASRPLPPLPVPTLAPAPKELLPSIRLRKRLDGLAIGIPSPITERSEEFSPRMSPTKLAKVQPRPHIASLSIKPAPLTLSTESLAIIEDFAITPPPVPVKDARFIPMSKFAVNGPSVKVVEHRPKRRKPRRSNTETAIIPQLAPPIELKKDKERPATMTGALERRDQLIMSPNTNKRIESGIVALAVQPTAEVSVARTISLERKQSQQILVSSPPPRSASCRRVKSRPVINQSRCMSPTFHEGRRGHKHGASLNLVIEGVVT